jgi:hypothetical protein
MVGSDLAFMIVPVLDHLVGHDVDSPPDGALTLLDLFLLHLQRHSDRHAHPQRR